MFLAREPLVFFVESPLGIHRESVFGVDSHGDMMQPVHANVTDRKTFSDFQNVCDLCNFQHIVSFQKKPSC